MSKLETPDLRVVVIARIWAYATAMLALSVLFGGPGRDWRVIFLPATIASGAAISTVVVWGSSKHQRRHNELPSSTKLDELTQRVENLETIAAHQESSISRDDNRVVSDSFSNDLRA